MNALADNVESLTDKDLLEDSAAQGLDAKKEGTSVRELLADAVLRAKKVHLREAVEGHRQAVVAFGARTVRLPETSAERRALLQGFVARKPQMREALTLQHRNFESLSDADVESALKQLDALGLLNGGDDDRECDPES